MVQIRQIRCQIFICFMMYIFADSYRKQITKKNNNQQTSTYFICLLFQNIKIGHQWNTSPSNQLSGSGNSRCFIHHPIEGYSKQQICREGDRWTQSLMVKARMQATNLYKFGPLEQRDNLYYIQGVIYPCVWLLFCLVQVWVGCTNLYMYICPPLYILQRAGLLVDIEILVELQGTKLQKDTRHSLGGDRPPRVQASLDISRRFIRRCCICRHFLSCTSIYLYYKG